MTELAATTKQDILEMIERMPDDTTIDDVLYALYVRASVDRGIADSKAGRTIPHEEVMKEVARWRQSSGR
jgi:predicted transcriptional regulator